MKRVALILVLTLATIQPLNAERQYRGWTYLANKLLADGVDKDLISQAFNDERLPEFDFVPFKVRPRETPAMYADHISDSRLQRARDYLETYKHAFSRAEKVYGVNRYIIAAIHSIETGCGKILGQELVFNRLARVSSVRDRANLKRNFKEQSKEDKGVTFSDLEARAVYLEETFYPEVKALLEESAKGRLSLFELKGSYGGAFGIGQFLPKSFQRFGTDGNENGAVSLFEPEDAIFSTSRFLHSFGWKESLAPGDKLRVLWNYNRSDPYGRMVTKVAVLLRGSTHAK